MAELAAEAMVQYPQVLENLRLSAKQPNLIDALGSEIAAVEEEFGTDGRVLVRMSGTEPLLRVMVEHADETTAHAAAERLISAAISLTS